MKWEDSEQMRLWIVMEAAFKYGSRKEFKKAERAYFEARRRAKCQAKTHP